MDLNYRGPFKKLRLYFLSVLASILIIAIFYMVLSYGSGGKDNKGIVLETVKEVDNSSNIVILIELDKKTLFLIDKKSKDTISTYDIASGRENTPTPLGTFQIVEKAHWGEGFGSRWLGLNVPWGMYGIHGTNEPGSIGGNVSEGCVRMRNSDIEEIYDSIALNTNVVITNGQYGPLGNGYRTLKPGNRGSDVMEVQKRLNRLGFYSGEIDGIYGEMMKQSVIKFLENKNLPLTDKIGEEIYGQLGIILMD